MQRTILTCSCGGSSGHDISVDLGRFPRLPSLQSGNEITANNAPQTLPFESMMVACHARVAMGLATALAHSSSHIEARA